MTTIASSLMAQTADPAVPRMTLPGLWVRTVLASCYPPFTRRWLQVSIARAVFIALFNTLCGALWLLAILVCAFMWVPRGGQGLARLSSGVQVTGYWAPFSETAARLLGEISQQWSAVPLLDKLATVVGGAVLLCGAFLVPFFVLLPFAARPGPNRPCVRHVARSVLLGTGLVHWWGAAFCLTALWTAPSFHADYAATTSRYLLVLSVLLPWHLLVLIHAVRRDYRTPADVPPPHDPWCDDCGYNLRAASPEGRCPECGRPVSDSLGPANRPPTPWEQRPGLLNFRVILVQAWTIIRAPRSLFFSMPTLTGQRAAQRWLALSMIAIALLASTMVPILFFVLDADWNTVAITGSLAMALAWANFGLMMVGVETAGIATFSRLRGHPGGGVPLAAAAKVTSYSSFLMLLWVILGGIQLIAFVYWTQPAHHFVRILGFSPQGEQIVLAVSLAIAHIGGLLWFELTVYRGIRAIQFANR